MRRSKAAGVQFATNLYLAILSLWGYPLHNALVAEFPIFMNATSIYLEVGVVRSHEVVGYSKAKQFLGEMIYSEAPLYSECQLCGDFQQGGCIYKLSSSIQLIPEHLWMSDRPWEQAMAKADP